MSWCPEKIKLFESAFQIAGVVLAGITSFVAIQIEMNIDKNAREQAQISRSIALSNHFFESVEYKSVLQVTSQMERQFAEKFPSENNRVKQQPRDQNRNQKTEDHEINFIIEMAIEIHEEEESFVDNVTGFLVHLDRISLCLDAKDNEKNLLCHEKTLASFYGTTIRYTWPYLRPFVCDGRHSDAQRARYLSIVRRAFSHWQSNISDKTRSRRRKPKPKKISAKNTSSPIIDIKREKQYCHNYRHFSVNEINSESDSNILAENPDFYRLKQIKDQK
ncbi:MAG: hypothetical protein AAF713_20410 [Pseudomonadota bacterium]